MTLRRLAILTAIVAALFGFIALFERKLPTTEQRLEKGDMLWDVNEGSLARISLLRGGESLEFVRSADDSWRMTHPESYPADGGVMSSLVFDLAHPAREGTAVEAPNGPDYGLMSPRAVVTISTKADKDHDPETWTISIGREIPGTDTVAARVKGEDRIVFVRSTLATDVLKPENDFKSRKVFTASAADVSQISIVRGRGRLDFEKRKNSWWMTHPVADLADATAVNRLIGDLIGENVSEFVKLAPTDLPGDGLQPPIFTVTLTANKKAHTVEIGATRSDGKTVYARSEGQNFAIESSVTDELSREADAYRETKIVRFDSFDVVGITAVVDGKTRAFVKTGVDWSENGKTVPPTAIDDLLTAVSAATGTDFISASEAAGIGQKPEALRLKISLKSGDTWDISFRPYDAKRFAARVTSRPEPLSIAAADLDRIISALQKVVPEPPKKSTPPPARAARKK